MVNNSVMRIHHHLSSLSSDAPIHWALGFFDGVHLGHQRVILSADTSGARRAVLTFAEHPLTLLRPEKQPVLLTPALAYKAELLAALGVDELVVLPFTDELAAMEPVAFLDMLRAAAPMAGISVGSNWRFGKDGSGNTDLVWRYAQQHGLRACVQSLLEQGGEHVCSSRIRSCLAAGDLAAVERMLGRPFSIRAVVEPGQKLARQLGFPTANMLVPAQSALPPFGVYAVMVNVDGVTYQGIANLGMRPTIQEEVKRVRLEMHVLDWSGDVYGRELTVQLHRFIRSELRFPDVESLKRQIAEDVACVRES